MPTTIEKKASEISEQLVQVEGISHAIAFDPLLLLALIQVIISLISFYKKCWSEKTALASMQNPGMFERMRLRWTVSSKLQTQFQHLKEKIIGAVRQVGNRTTEEEVTQMYKEV